MNTRHNQRFSETDTRIRQAFTELLSRKPIHRITVNELCALSEINRSTFYAHYLDIYDLMDKIEADISGQFVARLIAPDNASLGEGFEKLFEYILENRGFYSAYFSARFIAFHELTFPHPQAPFQAVVQSLRISEVELCYQERFFKAGLCSIIQLWLARDCRESPKEMAEILYREFNHDPHPFG